MCDHLITAARRRDGVLVCIFLLGQIKIPFDIGTSKMPLLAFDWKTFPIIWIMYFSIKRAHQIKTLILNFLFWGNKQLFFLALFGQFYFYF